MDVIISSFFFKKKKWFETLDSCAYPIAEVCILEPEFGLINESLRVLLCHNYVIYLLLHRASTLISFPCVWIFETLFIIRIEYFFYRKSFFFFLRFEFGHFFLSLFIFILLFHLLFFPFFSFLFPSLVSLKHYVSIFRHLYIFTRILLLNIKA